MRKRRNIVAKMAGEGGEWVHLDDHGECLKQLEPHAVAVGAAAVLRGYVKTLERVNIVGWIRIGMKTS